MPMNPHEGNVLRFHGMRQFLPLAAAIAASLAVAGPAGAAVAPVQLSAGIVDNSGQGNTCALLSDGAVRCWGANVFGQLGIPSSYVYNTRVPLTPWPVVDRKAIAVGPQCAVLDDHTVTCWPSEMGWNVDGGGRTKDNIKTAIQVTQSNYHSCALLSDGTVTCWGEGGRLGSTNGTSVRYNEPATKVAGISTAIQIAAGESHTCALLADHTIKCWGFNFGGQLGIGAITDGNPRYLATSVNGITNAVEVGVGYQHSCAVLADGTLKCWGSNGYGQVGADATRPRQLEPVTVPGITGAKHVAPGFGNTCVIVTDGAVKCWGAGDLTVSYGDSRFGSLSDGIVTVQGIAGATQIVADREHNCVLLSGGTVKCWGTPYNGTLGKTWTQLNNEGWPYPVTVLGIVPPEAPGVSGAPTVTTNSSTADISFSGASDVTFKCSLDGGGESTCTSPLHLTGLGSGTHTLAVKAIDSVGNESPLKSVSWTVDTTPPDVPQLSNVPASVTNAKTAAIGYSAESGATLSCSIDGRPFTACTGSPVRFTALGQGEHSLSVKATDAVGNVSETATATWTVRSFRAVVFEEPPTWWTAVRSGHWEIRAPVSTLGDSRGAAQALTVQISTVSHPKRALPTRAKRSLKVLGYSPAFTWNGRYKPLWIRVGTKGGKWTAWTAIVPRSYR